MRASDAEREATVEVLHAHAAAGRLDLSELEERIEAAFAARTRDELADLHADLPRAPHSDFPGHLRTFIAVQVLLVAIWAVTGAGYFWPVWPLMGWGIGVVVHGACDSGRQRAWASGSRRAPRRRAIAS